jgi:hypothetical protein
VWRQAVWSTRDSSANNASFGAGAISLDRDCSLNLSLLAAACHARLHSTANCEPRCARCNRSGQACEIVRAGQLGSMLARIRGPGRIIDDRTTGARPRRSRLKVTAAWEFLNADSQCERSERRTLADSKQVTEIHNATKLNSCWWRWINSGQRNPPVMIKTAHMHCGGLFKIAYFLAT